MKKFLTNLGRFTTKLVSLLVICGFISLACLPIMRALAEENGNTTDFGDCETPEAATPATLAMDDENSTDETPTVDETGTVKDDDETLEEGDEGGTGEGTDGEGGDEGGKDEDEPTEPKVYTVTIQYCTTDGKKIRANKVIEYTEANEYSLEPEDFTVGGYNKLSEDDTTITVTEDMLGQEDLITFTYEKIVDRGTLTVKYHYENESEKDTTRTEEIEVGKEYKIDDPSVENYEYVVDGELEGIMTANGIEVTITYTKKTTPPQPDTTKYEVTIKCIDDTGKTIKEYTEERTAGEQAFKAEAIPGYIMPSGEEKITVTGDQDKDVVIFTYERASATLTIHYVYDDENKTTAALDHTESVKIGDPYSVESPRVANYTADLLAVAGEMTAAGATHTVTYTRNSPDAPTEYTVTIHYRDAEDKDSTGKEIASSTTQVCKAGECVIEDDKYIDIAGYITPAKGDKITVQVDTSITLYYEKAPASNPENPGNDPGADEPGSDDPKEPADPSNTEDPNKNPDNQDPNTQQPSSQNPSTQNPAITLPTAGASDELIRSFLVLDAEVSAGGIGLWAVSGVIRKIRRR